jgi:CRP-like cAMP-binding protein
MFSVFAMYFVSSQLEQYCSAQCTVKSIRDFGLLGSQLQDLVSQMVEKTFPRGQDVFVRDEKTKPVMYLVRSGKVKLTKADGSEETVLPGEFFGQEHLAFKAKGSRAVLPEEITPKYSASAIATTVCGVLSLHDLAAVTGTNSQALQPQSHIGLKDLERHRLLGEGQYGNVWLVTNKKDDDPEPLALKVQKLKTRKNPDRSNAIRKETKLMRALQHQFVVKLLNVYTEETEMSMLMSLAPGGELFDVIHRQNADGYWISGMNEACAKFYTAVIADTLAFMHKQKFLYRDLKPENVLIDKDGYPVLTDFGFGELFSFHTIICSSVQVLICLLVLCKIAAKKLASGKTYTFCGTPNFVAPEVILQRGHDGAADNWSLGVLVFEMIDGDNPFWEEGMDNATLYDVICNSPYFPLPEHVTESAEHLISRLLEKNPSKRIGTFREKDILEHEWFARVDMEKLRNKKVKAPKRPDPIKL